MSYHRGLGQLFPGNRGNSNDGSPTKGNSNDGSPTRTEVRSPTSTSTSTEVRSPTSTSTSTEVRSPTSTSTDAYTRGNVTVTGGAGAGANTTVTVYQGKPGDFPERKGRAAGRTQERIVRDTIHGLMAPRPRGTPIPLQADTVRQYGLMAPRPRGTPIPLQPSTTQKVGLLGLGAIEAPITVGVTAMTDPILARASLLASQVMMKMSGVPKRQRLGEMVRLLNLGAPGLGNQALVEYAAAARRHPTAKDQVVFDTIRATLANHFATWTAARLAARGGMSGLGDAATDMSVLRSGFCTMGAGGVALTGGFFDQLGGASGRGGITGGATTAANIAGCGLESARLDAATALANANLATTAAAQTQAAQAAQEERMFRYALLGGGTLVTLVIVAALLKK